MESFLSSSCRPADGAKGSPGNSAPAEGQQPAWRGKRRFWATKLASLVVAGLLLGWAYTWAAPRLYGSEKPPGFWLGTVHGALMPVALPSLLLGQDVPIYAASRTGRSYKLGYIAGINACGFLFFGLAFRKR